MLIILSCPKIEKYKYAYCNFDISSFKLGVAKQSWRCSIPPSAAVEQSSRIVWEVEHRLPSRMSQSGTKRDDLEKRRNSSLQLDAGTSWGCQGRIEFSCRWWRQLGPPEEVKSKEEVKFKEEVKSKDDTKEKTRDNEKERTTSERTTSEVTIRFFLIFQIFYIGCIRIFFWICWKFYLNFRAFLRWSTNLKLKIYQGLIIYQARVKTKPDCFDKLVVGVAKNWRRSISLKPVSERIMSNWALHQYVECGTMFEDDSLLL